MSQPIDLTAAAAEAGIGSVAVTPLDAWPEGVPPVSAEDVTSWISSYLTR